MTEIFWLQFCDLVLQLFPFWNLYGSNRQDPLPFTRLLGMTTTTKGRKGHRKVLDGQRQVERKKNDISEVFSISGTVRKYHGVIKCSRSEQSELPGKDLSFPYNGHCRPSGQYRLAPLCTSRQPAIRSRGLLQATLETWKTLCYDDRVCKPKLFLPSDTSSHVHAQQVFIAKTDSETKCNLSVWCRSTCLQPNRSVFPTQKSYIGWGHYPVRDDSLPPTQTAVTKVRPDCRVLHGLVT